MSQPVGHMEYPHALSWRSNVLWRHSDKTTTVLSVKKTERITVEGAEPFYGPSSQSPAANFTHVIVEFHGLPFPCIFGRGDTVAGWSEQHHGDD